MTKPEQFRDESTGFDSAFEQLAVDNQANRTRDDSFERMLVALMDNKDKSNEPLVLKGDDFIKLGPKAEDVLKELGVEEIKFSKNADGSDRIEAKLSKRKTIDQDPKIDGTHSITIGTKFAANLKSGPSGSKILDGIEGVTAKAEGPLGNVRNATVVKMELSRNKDGTAQLSSTGKSGFVSSTKTRTVPGEVMDKADLLFKRLQEMRRHGANGSLSLPSIY